MPRDYIDAAWVVIGVLAVAALWRMALKKPRGLSHESVEMASARAWRESGKHSERERLRMKGA